MSNVSRGSASELQHRSGGRQWPVLARLPDVSPNPAAKTLASGAAAYRFDPPQRGESAAASAATANAALRDSKASAPRQPHVFERRHLVGQRGVPRRESAILPRTNPFAIPQARLVDSLAPAVRFLTMVALFAAAGTWIQMSGRHGIATSSPTIETPATAVQPALPAKNSVEPVITPPTAIGPLESPPQKGARVGRLDESGFASHEAANIELPMATRPRVMPPHCLIASGIVVPRVRTTEFPVSNETSSTGGEAFGPVREAAVDGNLPADDVPSMAQLPGFEFAEPSTR